MRHGQLWVRAARQPGLHGPTCDAVVRHLQARVRRCNRLWHVEGYPAHKGPSPQVGAKPQLEARGAWEGRTWLPVC